MNRTNRTKLRRLPNRGSHELAAIYAILDSGFLAHVGFQVDNQPYVIPTLYGRDEDKLSWTMEWVRHHDKYED